MEEKIEDFIKMVRLLKPKLVSYYPNKSWLKSKVSWDMGFYTEDDECWGISINKEEDLIEAKKQIEKFAYIVNVANFEEVGNTISVS